MSRFEVSKRVAVVTGAPMKRLSGDYSRRDPSWCRLSDSAQAADSKSGSVPPLTAGTDRRARGIKDFDAVRRRSPTLRTLHPDGVAWSEPTLS
jgi:hypothetical protein